MQRATIHNIMPARIGRHHLNIFDKNEHGKDGAVCSGKHSSAGHYDKENSVCGHEASKRVTFDEQSNEYYNSDPIDKDMCKELWFSISEMRRFKRTANSYIKDIQEVERRKTDSHAFTQVFIHAYHKCCTDDSDDHYTYIDDSLKHALSVWMGIGDRWGLEKRIVKDIHYDIHCRRIEKRKIVAEAQGMLGSADSEVHANYIRRACQIISGPSVTFARLIAEAQATSQRMRS